jgi:hypothetical protein
MVPNVAFSGASANHAAECNKLTDDRRAGESPPVCVR